MRKNNLFKAIVGGILILLLAMPALAKGEAPPPGAKPIKITYAGLLPVSHMLTKSQELFKELVEKRSNGVIKVDFFPAGQLYTDKTIMDAFTSGALEMGEVHPAMWAGKCPPMLAYYTLGAFDTPDQQWRYVDGPYTQILDRELVKLNTKILAWNDYGSNQGIISKKPLLSRKDLAGLKIRVMGALDSVFFEALGARPTIISSAETYMSLMRGTIDAAYSGMSGMIERKWYEGAKYILASPKGSFMHYASFPVGANLKWWNSLPKWAQDIIFTCNKESCLWSRKEAYKSDADAEKRIVELGAIVHYLSKEEWQLWRGEPLEKEKAYMMKIMGEEIGKQVMEAITAASK